MAISVYCTSVVRVNLSPRFVIRPRFVGFVRLVHARHDADIGGQFVGAFEVIDVSDACQIAAEREPMPLMPESSSNPSSTLAACSIALSSAPIVSNRLSAWSRQFDQRHEPAEINLPQALPAGQIFLLQLPAVAREQCTDLVQKYRAPLHQYITGVDHRPEFGLGRRSGQHCPSTERRPARGHRCGRSC